MTLLEYTQSLQEQKNPELKPEQIFVKAQEWKKNNPHRGGGYFFGYTSNWVPDQLGTS